MSQPVQFRWDAATGHMIPLVRFEKLADDQWGHGEVVTLVEHQERSMASHSHYFACINEAWKNLPETEVERFPTAEHLRKWALIRAGFRDERTIVCASAADAQRMAAFMKPLDEYAIIVPREATVCVYTAQSQSMKAMGKAVFQTSKDEVIGVLADLLRVTPDELAKGSKAHA